MKKISRASVLAMLCGALTMAAESPMIKYMKSGEIDVFEYAQIDSITFSHFDTDSVWHSDIVSHVIWVNGNPHINLIDDIDMVSFETPALELNPRVREIKDELWQKSDTVDYETFSITLDADFEVSGLPAVGDKL